MYLTLAPTPSVDSTAFPPVSSNPVGCKFLVLLLRPGDRIVEESAPVALVRLQSYALDLKRKVLRAAHNWVYSDPWKANKLAVRTTRDFTCRLTLERCIRRHTILGLAGRSGGKCSGKSHRTSFAKRSGCSGRWAELHSLKRLPLEA